MWKAKLCLYNAGALNNSRGWFLVPWHMDWVIKWSIRYNCSPWVHGQNIYTIETVNQIAVSSGIAQIQSSLFNWLSSDANIENWDRRQTRCTVTITSNIAKEKKTQSQIRDILCWENCKSPLHPWLISSCLTRVVTLLDKKFVVVQHSNWMGFGLEAAQWVSTNSIITINRSINSKKANTNTLF